MSSYCLSTVRAAKNRAPERTQTGEPSLQGEARGERGQPGEKGLLGKKTEGNLEGEKTHHMSVLISSQPDSSS